MQHTLQKQEDVLFSEKQHQIWAKLFKGVLLTVMDHACSDWLVGFERLGLNPKRIPTIQELNEKMISATGWKTERTSVRYTDAIPWYGKFDQRIFLVTDFLRSEKELAFTPEPDMFHDVIGHLPFMTIPHYTALQDMFAPAFLAAADEKKENIKRLAWFSTEFGLIRENGKTKIFGAGLLSSSGEMEHIMSGKVPIKEFTIDNVLKEDKAMWTFNKQLFIIDSIEQLKQELSRYF